MFCLICVKEALWMKRGGFGSRLAGEVLSLSHLVLHFYLVIDDSHELFSLCSSS